MKDSPPSLCITRTCPNQRKLVENFHVRTTQAAPTGPDQGRSKHRRPQQAEEAQGRGQAQTQSQAQSQDAYPSQPPGPGGETQSQAQSQDAYPRQPPGPGGRPRARPRARTHTQANPQVQGRSGRPKNVANGQDLNDVGTLQASKPLRLAPSNLTNHCKGSTMENTNSPNRRSCRIKLGAQTQARPSQSTPIAAGDLKWQSYIRSLLGNGIVLRGWQNWSFKVRIPAASLDTPRGGQSRLQFYAWYTLGNASSRQF